MITDVQCVLFNQIPLNESLNFWEFRMIDHLADNLADNLSGRPHKIRFGSINNTESNIRASVSFDSIGGNLRSMVAEKQQQAKAWPGPPHEWWCFYDFHYQCFYLF
jgi:hypothetical protein